MKKDVFNVKFISVRNCFMYFSENYLRKLNGINSDVVPLLVEYGGGGQKAYFSWSAEAGPIHDDCIVCINSVYAQALGIEEGETVIISLQFQAQPLSHIHVLPLSSDDWQILMLKSNDVQSSVLDQVRVVWLGQVLVIWVSRSFHLRVVIESLRPSHAVGILQPFTEVVVSSPSEATSIDSVTSRNSSVGSLGPVTSSRPDGASDWGIIARLLSGLKRLLPSAPESSDMKIGDSCKSEPRSAGHGDETSKLHFFDSTKKVTHSVLRVHPFQIPTTDISNSGLLYHPYNVYVSREYLNAIGVNAASHRNVIICKITKILFPKSSTDKVSPGEETRIKTPTSSRVRQPYIFVRLCFIDGEGSTLQPQVASHPRHDYALFTPTTMAALQLSVGGKVRVDLIPTEESQPTITELYISPCKVWDKSWGSLDSTFRRHLAAATQKSSLLLNSNMNLPICVASTSLRDVYVRLMPSSADYVLLDIRSLEKCKLFIEDANSNNSDEVKLEEHHNTEVEEKFSGSLRSVLEDGLKTLELGLQIRKVVDSLEYIKTALSTMNILIVGKTGSGKSTVSKALCHHLGKSPHYVHSVHVQCRYLKGKKVETLQKLMNQWLEECVYYQPSVLVLDDLETMVGMSNPEASSSAEGIYFTRVGERLVDTLQEFQSVNDICVVATTSSLKKLNHAVMAPRGRHVFHTVLHIQELTKADRLESLEYILSRTACTDGNLTSLDLVANQTEGYVMQDLVDLVDKAVFEMYKRTASDDCCLIMTDRDLEEAKRNMMPLSLHGINLFQNSAIMWDDVGGLVEVKQVLEQILMWPSQYPELFVQCPLRQQSGVLLYGAPGTGKTYLAGAIAHHCGLNFISVKGPELLSKYIGASEEAVRNIFEKARSARPCILFFDEFDSLAPRRGHDSTGVTDRVVNQLLTQLDGVESLLGVWVIGATSRPDLLDPALLRPGRLDHTILCPLPHKDDRVLIMKALSRKLLLADGVDLDKIATQTVDFTGADLQALLYTAQLSATTVTKSNLPDVLPACSGIEISLKTEDDSVSEGRHVVTQEHLLAALRDTRRSLSPQEILKYQLIYQKFSNSIGGNITEDTIMLPQKATLA